MCSLFFLRNRCRIKTSLTGKTVLIKEFIASKQKVRHHCFLISGNDDFWNYCSDFNFLIEFVPQDNCYRNLFRTNHQINYLSEEEGGGGTD